MSSVSSARKPARGQLLRNTTADFLNTAMSSPVFLRRPPLQSTDRLYRRQGAAENSATYDRLETLPAELANHPDYEIVRELGQGGMGAVFLAHNRILGRDEALKVIGPEIIESPGVFDRFLREIRAVAKLQHPNIVTAHAAFRCGASLVFAMEYVEGLDLARMVMAKGPVPSRHACYFVHQAALGLQHAHEAGMVHRDIKPSNLMLTHKAGKAVIKVLDFGLAKAGSEQNVQGAAPAAANIDLRVATGLTLPGEMLGTPDFIAPEQIANSQRADIRADIYSMGCTMYYLLSGRPPFQSASMRDTLRAHHRTEAPLLHVLRPEVPPELTALVAKMMAKEPDRRFQSPSDVATALVPFFKKPATAAVSPYLDVDKDFAADAGHPAPDSASATGRGMWSSLIDFGKPEDDMDSGERALKTGARSTAMVVAGGSRWSAAVRALGRRGRREFSIACACRMTRSNWQARTRVSQQNTKSWFACCKSRQRC